MSDRYWVIGKYDANEEELKDVKVRLIAEVLSKINQDFTSIKVDFDINWEYLDYYEMLCTVTVEETS